MKSKRQIALALMASLGLFTLGAVNANAQSNGAGHKTDVNQLSKPMSKQALSNLVHNSEPKDRSSIKVSKGSSFNQANAKRSSHQNGDRDGLKTVHVTIKPDHMSISHHGSAGQRSHDNVVKAVVHHDNDPHNIDGMGHFTQERRHYLYTKIGGNTRDLGGYPTQNHKYQTKPDRVIRSADLDGLSKSGLKTLNQLHVNKVVDLRYYEGKNGIEGHPDPNELSRKTLNAGISYQKAPVYSHTEAHQLSKYMKSHDERGEYYFYGDLSVTKPQAIKAYRKVFTDLLHNQHGAILLHCNLGRDRTGTTSALILSALGVNRNLIYHDYLLTDRYHYHFDKSQPYPKQAAELQHFFGTIDKNYGSVNGYLTNKIGLSHAKLNQLRKMYLMPRNQHRSSIKNGASNGFNTHRSNRGVKRHESRASKMSLRNHKFGHHVKVHHKVSSHRSNR